MVRLIVDEDCDFAVVRALRGAGFDVLAVAEVSPRATDDPASARKTLPQEVVRVIRERGEQLIGSFAVVQPGRTRIGRRPTKT